MTDAKANTALEQYLSSLKALWQVDSATDSTMPHRVRDLMVAWLAATPPQAAWVQSLKKDKTPGRPLYTDPTYGFIQMSHFHKGYRSNAPHDHGPYWVVYGVYEGEVDIPVYKHNAHNNTLSIEGIDHLKSGDAIAYFPGEIHSTRVPTAEPAIVLRFLSTDLSQVPRQRFKLEQIVD